MDFDPALARRITGVLDGAPNLATGAGHDAGILAAVVPTAMLFTRNPTGVSHSPEEACTDEDASWTLRIHAGGVTTTPGTDAGDGAACTVRGSAGDLYLALWNRTGAEALVIDGDRAVLGLFNDSVQVRWA